MPSRAVEGRREAFAKAGQQCVAGQVAERVVVLLEAIEVEQREDQRLPVGGLRERGREVVDQRATVGEAGQRVMERLLATERQERRVLDDEALGQAAGTRRAPVEEAEGEQQQEDQRDRAERGL